MFNWKLKVSLLSVIVILALGCKRVDYDLAETPAPDDSQVPAYTITPNRNR